MTGGVASLTVTLKVLVAVLPAASVAVQVTVVSPSGKVLPEAGVQVGVIEPSTISLAVAVKLTSAPLGPLAGTVLSAGRVSVGAVVSSTVAVKKPVAERPPESVTEQLTCVLPSEKVLPEAGTQVGVSGPSCASLAVALKLTVAPSGPVASAVGLDGRVSVGAVLVGGGGAVTCSVKEAGPTL
jgi:hypothetical protein